MMCLVAVIAGLAIYVVLQVRQRTPLNAQQASAIATAAVQDAGPVMIHFRTGLVKPGENEKPSDPNYRLLEKAGLVKLAKGHGSSVGVTLTPAGEHLLTDLTGLTKTKEANGTVLYEAPLAKRQFVGIASIEMVGANAANVQYNWKWVPNQLGDVFDADGSLVKGFDLSDRQTLINKYGADFYNGDQNRSTIGLVRTGKEWKVATQ